MADICFFRECFVFSVTTSKIQDVDGFDLDPHYKLSQLAIRSNCELIAIPRSCDVESSLAVSGSGCSLCELKVNEGRSACGELHKSRMGEGTDVQGVNKSAADAPILASRTLSSPIATDLKRKSISRTNRLLHLGHGICWGKKEKSRKCFRDRTSAMSRRSAVRRKRYIQRMISGYQPKSDLEATTTETKYTDFGVSESSPRDEQREGGPILDYRDETTKLTVTIPLEYGLCVTKAQRVLGEDCDRHGSREVSLLDVDGGFNDDLLLEPRNTTEQVNHETLNRSTDSAFSVGETDRSSAGAINATTEIAVCLTCLVYCVFTM